MAAEAAAARRRRGPEGSRVGGFHRRRARAAAAATVGAATVGASDVRACGGTRGAGWDETGQTRTVGRMVPRHLPPRQSWRTERFDLDDDEDA